MSYIYVITNDINGKQYVGQTSGSLEKRFKQHINDMNKRSEEKRPLYNAMKKYGIEHFHIALIEECSYKEIDKKEIYWIGKLDTYKNGYNATLGGDGTSSYDYKEIAQKYLELQNQKKTADYFHCDIHTVRVACMQENIPIVKSGMVTKKIYGKKVYMRDLKTKDILKVFDDQSDAGRWLVQQNVTQAQIKHISNSIGKVAKGERKSAYGYYWTYD